MFYSHCVGQKITQVGGVFLSPHLFFALWKTASYQERNSLGK